MVLTSPFVIPDLIRDLLRSMCCFNRTSCDSTFCQKSYREDCPCPRLSSKRSQFLPIPSAIKAGFPLITFLAKLNVHSFNC